MLFNINSLTSPILRFYARCFIYPYEEMGYELQHMFRQLERTEITEDDHPVLEQILNVINHFQGEDLKELRDNYVSLFSQWGGGHTPCSLLASHFTHAIGTKYDSELFVDLLIDSDIPKDPDDPMDSIVYYLEYFSLLCENPIDSSDNNRVIEFYQKHMLVWIPQFCDQLYRLSNISFYKEVAIGLNAYLLQTGE